MSVGVVEEVVFSQFRENIPLQGLFDFLMSQFWRFPCCGPSESVNIYSFKAGCICACIQTTSHSAKFKVQFSL